MKALLILLAAGLACGQTLTTITDQVVGPDGQPVNGQASVLLNGACQSANDYVGPKSITVFVANGVFTVSLVPNSGGCSNTAYGVQWALAGGAHWIETWKVPVSSTPLTINEVLVNASGAPNWARGSYSINITTPLTSDTGLLQYVDAYAYNVASVSCSTDTGSVTINLDVRSSATPNTAGTNVLSAPLVCGATATATGTLSSGVSVPGGSPINLQVLAVSGSPDVVRIFVQKSAQ